MEWNGMDWSGMKYGIWNMEYGMEYGMENGMEYGKWKMEYGKWKMEWNGMEGKGRREGRNEGMKE